MLVELRVEEHEPVCRPVIGFCTRRLRRAGQVGHELGIVGASSRCGSDEVDGRNCRTENYQCERGDVGGQAADRGRESSCALTSRQALPDASPKITVENSTDYRQLVLHSKEVGRES